MKDVYGFVLNLSLSLIHLRLLCHMELFYEWQRIEVFLLLFIMSIVYYYNRPLIGTFVFLILYLRYQPAPAMFFHSK